MRIQRTAVGHALLLKIIRSSVAGQGQNYRPLVRQQKGLHTVPSHVRGYRDGIESQLLQQAFSVLRSRVADVSPLGVCDGQMTGVLVAQIANGLLQRFPTFQSVRLIKRQVWFVGYRVISSCVDDGFVEVRKRCRLCGKTARQLGNVRIQAHAQHGLAGLNNID